MSNDAATTPKRSTWAEGDYAQVARITQPLGDLLCEGVDLKPGSRVLDVATGTGHTALAAARRFCRTVGLDYVPALLAHARRRADAECIPLELLVGDAQALPFPDGAFDYVLSSIGAMFAPDHRQTARELLRVCRRGGTVGMVNWSPDGVVAEQAKLRSRFVTAPAGQTPAAQWGDEAHVRSLMPPGSAVLSFTRGSLTQRFPSAELYADFFIRNFGPTVLAWEGLDAEAQSRFRAELMALAKKFSRSADGTIIYDSGFLLVRAIKQ